MPYARLIIVLLQSKALLVPSLPKFFAMDVNLYLFYATPRSINFLHPNGREKWEERKDNNNNNDNDMLHQRHCKTVAAFHGN